MPNTPPTYPLHFVVGLILFCTCSLPRLSYASPEDEFRKKLVLEVTREIGSSPLVNDIVEIRFRREFEVWQKRQIEQTVQPLNDVNTNPIVKAPAQSNGSVYVAGGTRIAIGHSIRESKDWGWRVEVSATDSKTGFETIGVNQYHYNESNLSAGSFLDWYPFDSGLRLSFGINANRMRNYVTTPVASSMTLGNKSFNTGSETLDITYKFPRYSPYLGLGYQSNSPNEKGWSIYGDLGWKYGRYDAYARTSLIGMHSVSAQDVEREMNAIRDSLYKHAYVRVGVLGMSYRY